MSLIKSVYKVPILPRGPSCPLKTILLGDLVRVWQPMQIVMAIWFGVPFFQNLKLARRSLPSAAVYHTQPSKFILKKRVPNGYYNLFIVLALRQTEDKSQSSFLTVLQFKG
jgi:hypothetical protein